MSEQYRITGIRHSKGALECRPREDGRYPKRIGRICERPQPVVGQPMIIKYIANADGTDYSNYQLRTSMVRRILSTEDILIIETMNSFYDFVKVRNSNGR